MNAHEAAERYGIGIAKLRQMRQLGLGPEFRRFGQRTVLYEVVKLEAWITSLPPGGAAVA
jgi:hypothetical protein